MPRRLLCGKFSRVFLLLFLASLLRAGAQPASIPPLVIEGVGIATAPLDGEWQFHLRDDAAWAAPGLDDSGWEPIRVDKSWGEQTHFGYTGYAWYRRHITLTAAQGANIQLGLFLPPVDDAYEVYWNGVLIGQCGKLPPDPVWYFQPPYRTFDLGSPRSGVVAIRVWKAPYVSFDSGTLGGPVRAPLIGSAAAIEAYKVGLDHRWLKSQMYTFGLDLLYAVIGIFSFLAWLRNRRQRIPLWMAIFSINPLVAQCLVGLRFPLPFSVSIGVLQPFLGLEDIALWFLLLYLLRLDGNPGLRRWTKMLAIITIIATSLDGALSFLSVDVQSF